MYLPTTHLCKSKMVETRTCNKELRDKGLKASHYIYILGNYRVSNISWHIILN
jgi:hypothetical protein